MQNILLGTVDCLKSEVRKLNTRRLYSLVKSIQFTSFLRIWRESVKSFNVISPSKILAKMEAILSPPFQINRALFVVRKIREMIARRWRENSTNQKAYPW